MSVLKRITFVAVVGGLAMSICVPLFGSRLMGVFSGASLQVDTQIEKDAVNNAARILPVPKAGDTVTIQLFAAAGAGQATNGFALELELPGRTFSSYLGTLSGVDWHGNALTSTGAAQLTALFPSPATVPATGYLGQINVPVTTALESGATLAVKRMTMTSGSELDSLNVFAAVITFVTGGGNPGDYDNDGTVGLSDFLLFANVFGTSESAPGFDRRMDFNADGNVGLSDFLAFANVFGKTYATGGGPLQVVSIRNLTNNRGEDRSPSWSPDGRHVAFRSDRDGNREIYVMGTDGTEPRNLTNSGTMESDPVWSPDGLHIAYVYLDRSKIGGNRRYKIYAVGPDGSNLRRVVDRGFGYGFRYQVTHPAWSPNSRHIAGKLYSTDYIFRVDADRSDYRVLFEDEGEEYYNEPPEWSRDGRFIAFVNRHDGGTTSSIYVMRWDGSNPRELTTRSEVNHSVSWSPDGRHIAFSTNRDGNWEIYVTGLDGSDPRNLTSHDGRDTAPAYSPDGRYIAFKSDRDGFEGDSDIYVMKTDGSDPRKLTSHSRIGKLLWSPDGRRIAFETDRDADWEIYVMDLQGGQ